MNEILGQDIKLLIKVIDPAIIMNAAMSVAETKWIMGTGTNDFHRLGNSKDEWIEAQATSLFRQLHAEVNS
jgi:hypothetical protein